MIRPYSLPYSPVAQISTLRTVQKPIANHPQFGIVTISPKKRFSTLSPKEYEKVRAWLLQQVSRQVPKWSSCPNGPQQIESDWLISFEGYPVKGSETEWNVVRIIVHYNPPTQGPQAQKLQSEATRKLMEDALVRKIRTDFPIRSLIRVNRSTEPTDTIPGFSPFSIKHPQNSWLLNWLKPQNT